MPQHEDIQELIESKISQHDKNRFEVKLDVLLSEEQKHGQYVVEAYFFIPRSLGVDSRSYPSSEFYGDIQNYIRFKTPVIGLRKLADESYEYSPFKRLDRAVEAILGGDRTDVHILKAVHELKLLGCVVRSDVRDHAYFLLTEGQRLDGSAAEAEPLVENARQFLSDLDFLVHKIRSIRPRILSPGLPTRIRDAYQHLDEFVSLTIESYFTVLTAQLSQKPALKERLKALFESLEKVMGAEQAHRKAMGFPSLVDPTCDNEGFAHRRSMLKKYISSLLYLDIDVTESTGAREFVLSLAAGIAMLVSVLAMVWVQSRYAFNSLIFIAVATVTYMFKDRIKDWLKRYFTSYLGGFLTDHSVRITDPSTQEVIGRFQEAVTFVPKTAVPDVVVRARGDLPLEGEGGPEVVLKYVKKVRLHPKRIFEHHHRLKAINDILRFSVTNFLGKMDDPKADYLFYNPQSRQLEQARLARTYPVDVVLALSAQKNGGVETRYERVRLILTRKGIKRMEVADGGPKTP